MVFGLHTCFGFVVVVFSFLGVGCGFDSFICFGLQTHLVVASLPDDWFFILLLSSFLGFIGFHSCLVEFSEGFDTFGHEVSCGL